jgi:hypothetical protein
MGTAKTTFGPHTKKEDCMSQTTPKTMRINHVDYVEAPAPEAGDSPDGVCGHCALYKEMECAHAIDYAAAAAFGGDCEARDVVYVKAPTKQSTNKKSLR